MSICNIKEIIDEVNLSEIFTILRQLTAAPELADHTTRSLVKQLPSNHNIFVCLGHDKKVIAMITALNIY
jgi:hypothetical protein